MRNKRFGAGWDDADELDPMSGMSNLADVMLVFACGLMVALMLHWNVDLRPPKALNEERLLEITSSDMQSRDNLDGERYQPEGTVYRDTETGKLYIVN